MDLITMATLNSVASDRASSTEDTENHITQLLDHLVIHSDAKIRYHASDMVLNIHSDASCLSEGGTKGRMTGQYFLGSTPNNKTPF